LQQAYRVLLLSCSSRGTVKEKTNPVYKAIKTKGGRVRARCSCSIYLNASEVRVNAKGPVNRNRISTERERKKTLFLSRGGEWLRIIRQVSSGVRSPPRQENDIQNYISALII